MTTSQAPFLAKSPQRLPSVIFALLLLIPAFSLSSNALSASPTSLFSYETRTYRFQVITTYDNLSSSYYGIETVYLNSTGTLSYDGLLFWNLTYDNGLTWSSDMVQITYDWNRTYRYSDLTWYTGWWIHPGVSIGAQVQIDGDTPATNNHPRIQPFTVTDLVSLELNHQYFLCWQLTYATSRQHETFYYDYYCGILLSATTIVEDTGIPVHKIYVTLESANPTPQPIHPIFHFWHTYSSFIIACFGATLLAAFVYSLLDRLATSRFYTSSSASEGITRLKNEPKTAAPHTLTGE